VFFAGCGDGTGDFREGDVDGDLPGDPSWERAVSGTGDRRPGSALGKGGPSWAAGWSIGWGLYMHTMRHNSWFPELIIM